MDKGFVIVGYQGIGKSTLANSCTGRYIDLESSNFFVDNNRASNWATIYVKIAESLANQGYVVFVSSHAEVRTLLRNCRCDVGLIFPDASLQDAWILKLKNRYFETENEKDFKAWQNAKNLYESSIRDLMHSPKKSCVIDDMNYNLETIVGLLKEKIDESKA